MGNPTAAGGLGGTQTVCKRLSIRDVNLLRELSAVFADAFGEAQTYLGAIPGDDYPESLLADDDFVALTAIEEGKVVGGLVAYVLKKFEHERKEAYIYDLAVLLGYRRRGIARRLLMNLKAIARDAGVHLIFVQADPPDIPAICLYKSFGTKEEVLHFDIPVD